MTCPPEIAEVVREILKTGILRIRQLAWAQDAGRCAVEADHIHNLPDLLTDYSPDLLRYYWEAERTSFIQQSATGDRARFDPLWAKLAPHLGNAPGQTVLP
jgi:hypothetical protein